MIDKVTRMAALYDLYGKLLTPRQRQVFELTYFDDWSLAEIAEHLGVSRQAVHDNLHRAEEQLEHYEAQVGFFAWRQRLQVLVDNAAAVGQTAYPLLPDAVTARWQSALDALTQAVSRTSPE
ncbi:YlxM family DNA-binding protein [Alicyclobacillus kakegawensis]|uniref:YlxM family DNA-binding protein n=1 Tax=Alicyclobacillus kakegawensis TaxID=392012 RepID=UPI0009F91F59|nr:YlxM family DNA-binding protein [Alicyclobacillus kakegawensis]